MRVVSESISDAITNQVSYRINAKLKIFASRHYFKDTDIVNKCPAGGDALIAATLPNPVSEAIDIFQGSGNVHGIYVDGGKLKGLVSGNDTPVALNNMYGGHEEITADPLGRPSILTRFDPDSNKFGFLIYWSGTDWCIRGYRNDLFDAGTDQCVGAESIVVDGENIGVGACYQLSSHNIDDPTTGEKAFFYIDDGGVRVALMDSDGNIHKSVARFMDPNHILDGTNDDDVYRTHKTGAVRWVDPISGNAIYYFYYTAHDGSVQAMSYEWNQDTSVRGIWGEIFTAIPEDLSTFAISNVFIQDNKVWMMGRFTRRSDFASSSVYTLLVWSTDGRTFAMDRTSLVSIVDKRWLATFNQVTSVMHFWALGYTADKAGAYQIDPTNCYNITYRLSSLSGSALSGWSANAVAGAEYGFDDIWLDEGSYAELLIGISIGDSTPTEDDQYEWISYQQCIIGGVNKAWGDGKRALTIQIVPDGIWHAQNMTYPFYMEIQSKQYLFSPMKAFDTLYNQNPNAGQIWSLVQDFSTQDEPNGFTALSHAAYSVSDHWCDDLELLCTSYPTFGDAADYDINIYGWSRGGELSLNPNVADPTDPSTLNDDFYPILIVEDLSGNQIEIIATSLVSTYKNPPQTWFPAAARDGSYPIVFSITNPGEGFKIIKLGVRVAAGSVGATTYFLERIEMPAILAEYTTLDTNTGFVITPDVALPHSIPDLFSYTGMAPWIDIPYSNITSTLGIDTSHTWYGYYRFYPPNDGKTHYFDLTIGFGSPLPTEPLTLEMYYDAISGVPIATVSGIGSVSLTKSVTLTYGHHICSRVLLDHDNFQSPYVESVSITSYSSDVPVAITDAPVVAKSVQKGIQQLLFATTPYSAWNFDVIVRTKINGTWSYSGGIGLATDNKNFTLGYCRLGYIGIAKIRNGLRTILVEQAEAGIVADTSVDVRFWHRNGSFGVEYKLATETDWPARGSMLTYEWQEADGEIAPIVPIAAIDSSGLAVSIIDTSEINAYVFHVGIYSIIDPPKFRTTGFNSNSLYIPVMPIDINPNTGKSDFYPDGGAPDALFPASGVVDCNGYKFIYSSKNVFFGLNPIKGPFQVRNVLDWSETNWETDLEDGYHYLYDRAIEFYNFEWLDSDGNHNKYLNALIAISANEAWKNAETFFKPWITTGGEIVMERERGRYYGTPIGWDGNEIPENLYINLSNQAWITHGLAGISSQTPLETSVSFDKGNFVYLDEDDSVIIQGFMAFSGEDDSSIQMLLDKFCRIAGTEANFPGDTIVATHLFGDGESLAL